MTEPFIRPDVAAFLEAMKAVTRPPMNEETIGMIRQIPPGSMPSVDLPVGDLGEVRNVTMPGPGGTISLRLFDSRAQREPGPVVVFFHGGGFIVGSIDTHAALAAEIARVLDLPVVSVEYRLAPEHPWPAAPEDAEAAARWIAENGAAFGRMFTALILCGDSAGGNLTVTTAMALRDKPAALPVMLQFPIYPLTDFTVAWQSRRQFGDGFGLTSQDTAYYDRAYAADDEHWSRSPGRHDLGGMPPALVVTAGLCPFLDEGRAYAEKLRGAGVKVQYLEMEGTIHGFATFRLRLPSAQDDVSEMLRAANLILAEASA